MTIGIGVVQDEVTVARVKLASVAEECGLAFGELVNLWSEDTGRQLAAAAVALENGDLVEAARLAHGASGASGICGVERLAEELRAVEYLAKQGRADKAQPMLMLAQVRFAELSVGLRTLADHCDKVTS